MSPKCKVSFFFLFKLFTKSSWKSERQLPLQGLKSIKTTTEQLKQSEREKEKETTSNVWHLVLSTGFPRAPLGIESKIHWQTRLLNTQKGSLGASCPQRRLCAVRLWGAQQSLRLRGWPLFIQSPLQETQQPTMHWASAGLPSSQGAWPPAED